MTREELIAAAVSMLDRAYCPYSRFAVGAALECADGSVYTGCNVENAAFSPTLCAERVAVGKAVSEGHTDFVRIAVASRGSAPCTPCGVCRQVLQEFAPEMEVLCVSGRGTVQTLPLRDLLPYGFGLSFEAPADVPAKGGTV